MTKTALIIGITGGIGNHAAHALIANGWHVRALHRHPDQARKDFPQGSAVDWIKGDAMNENDVVTAAQGVDIIFHGANPPAYKNWRGLALPMLKNAITAAKSASARLVFPGNVYNYGPDAWSVVTEDSPQNPKTRKGAVRAEMERMLRIASTHGCRVLILRAGDYFGANAPSSWLPNVIVKPGKKIGSVTYPGKSGVGHAWAYLPDVGNTIARLVERESELATFEIFNFGGHYFDDGQDFVESIKRVANVPDAPTKAMPWFMLFLASPFVSLFREILEMRYLWSVDLKLDNSKLASFLGAEPHTPLDHALKNTLVSMRCI